MPDTIILSAGAGGASLATDANPAYLYYGTTATTTKFTVLIPSGGSWTMPSPVYTGRIDVIWSADGTGSLIGSEL